MVNKKTVLLLSLLFVMMLFVRVSGQDKKQSSVVNQTTEISMTATDETADDIEIPENASYKQTVRKYEMLGVMLGDEGDKTVNIFDESDNLLLSVGYDRRTTYYSYDADGKLLEKNEYFGDMLYLHYEYKYDENGRLSIEIVYKYGKESERYEYKYDSSDRVIGKEYPSGSCEYYKYDDNGNIIEKTYGDSVDEYTYDEENCLIKHRHHVEYDWRADYTYYYEYEYEEL